MWTTIFWKNATERAIKTFAQTLVATITVLIGSDQLAGVTSFSWPIVLSTALLASLLSILTSIGNIDTIIQNPKPKRAEIEDPPARPDLDSTPIEVAPEEAYYEEKDTFGFK